MGAWRRITLTGCALAALALPVSSNAAETRRGAGTEIQDPSAAALLEVGGDSGYRAAVVFPTPRIAVLYVARGGRRISRSATYVVRTRNRIDGDVLRADFGAIGRLAVRFVAHRVRRAGGQRGCTGPRPIIEAGRFRGRVALRGEDGYFQLRASSGPAFRERGFRLVCRRGRASNLPPGLTLRDFIVPNFRISIPFAGGSVAQLRAAAKVDGRGISLVASHEGGAPAGAEVEVSTVESGAGIAIGRNLSLAGGAGTLTTSLPGAHPAHATLAPPAPFRGAAEFLASSPSSHRWRGPLRVTLPGLTLALTGPRFHTSVCVLSPLKSPGGCDYTTPKPMVPERLRIFPAREWAP
jgi:hypothetical protein